MRNEAQKAFAERIKKQAEKQEKSDRDYTRKMIMAHKCGVVGNTKKEMTGR